MWTLPLWCTWPVNIACFVNTQHAIIKVCWMWRSCHKMLLANNNAKNVHLKALSQLWLTGSFSAQADWFAHVIKRSAKNNHRNPSSWLCCCQQPPTSNLIALQIHAARRPSCYTVTGGKHLILLITKAECMEISRRLILWIPETAVRRRPQHPPAKPPAKSVSVQMFFTWFRATEDFRPLTILSDTNLDTV